MSDSITATAEYNELLDSIKRNGVPGEFVVRLRPTKVVAVLDVVA